MTSTRLRAAAVLVLPIIAVAGCSSSSSDGIGSLLSTPPVSPSAGSSSPGSPSVTVPSPSDSSPTGSGDYVQGTGFEVSLPPDWRVATEEEKSKAGATDVYFGPSSGGFTVNVNVGTDSVPSGTGVGEYIDGQVANLRANSKFMNVSDPTPRSFGSEEGAQITAEQMQGGLTIRQRFDVVIHNGTAYIVTYSATTDSYDDAEPAATSIVDSLRFT